MKKRYLLATVVVAGALIAPKLVSTQVKDQLDQAVARIGELNGYNAQVSEFNSGWFSSNGVIQVSLEMAQIAPDIDLGDNQDTTFEVTFEAHHGPIYFTPTPGLGWANWTASFAGDAQRESFEWDEDQPFYQVQATHGLLGGISIDDEITAFKASDTGDGQSVEFSGYRGQGRQVGDQYHYQGTAGSINVVATNGTMALNNVGIVLEVEEDLLKALQGQLVDSAITLSLQSAQFGSKAQAEPLVQVEKLQISAASRIDEQEEFASMRQQIALKQVTAMGYQASDLNLEIEINQLSVAFMRAYQEFVQTMSGADEQELTEQTMAFFETNSLAFLQASPELNVSDFSGTLSQGSFDASSINKLVDVEVLPADPNDPGFWLTHVQSATNIVMDKPVAEFVAGQYMLTQLRANPQTAGMTADEMAGVVQQQVPMMINSLMQQGLIVEQGEQYQLSFTLKDRQASLNGNPIPLPY